MAYGGGKWSGYTETAFQIKTIPDFLFSGLSNAMTGSSAGGGGVRRRPRIMSSDQTFREQQVCYLTQFQMQG